MSETKAAAPVTDALVAAVEAVLFAAGEPVQPHEIAAAFAGTGAREVQAAIETLRERYAAGPGGLAVEQVAGGFRLATKTEVGPLVRTFFRQRNRTRLSPAALETLAIVAYRQPVTGPEVQGIRGVDPSGALKSLLEKKMIRILGRKKVVGSPLLYGTTRQFLVHFGLNRLEDLPSIEEFDRLLGSLSEAGAGDGGPVAVPQSADDAEDPAAPPGEAAEEE